jgi:hypothetical protein
MFGQGPEEKFGGSAVMATNGKRQWPIEQEAEAVRFVLAKGRSARILAQRPTDGGIDPGDKEGRRSTMQIFFVSDESGVKGYADSPSPSDAIYRHLLAAASTMIRR